MPHSLLLIRLVDLFDKQVFLTAPGQNEILNFINQFIFGEISGGGQVFLDMWQAVMAGLLDECGRRAPAPW